MPRRILITGGCGVVGTILKQEFKRKYEITCLDRRLTSSECVMGDVTNLGDIERYFFDKDVVIHLAANASLDADWQSVYTQNILGTYNVFESSRRANVGKVILASSNHVTGLYEKDSPILDITKGDLENLDLKKIPMVSHLSATKPDSLYGASKLFGEGLGRYYNSEFGISVICLRIGTVRAYDWPKPSETRFFATWLSHRDLVQLVERSIESDRVGFDVFYGVSDNKWRFWDISHAKDILGYKPQDDAETYRPNIKNQSL